MAGFLVPFAGHLAYEQPEKEFRRWRRMNIAGSFLAGSFGAFAVALAVFAPAYAPSTSVAFPIVMGLTGIFFLIISTANLRSTRRAKPFRLYEEGILTPEGQFLPYDEFLDAYLLPPVRTKKPIFLFLTHREGRAYLIGAPNTKSVIFQAADFDTVSALVAEGVRTRGYRSGIEWTDGARAMLEAASIFRAPILVALEASARRSGVSRIDEEFIRRAVADPTVAHGMIWRSLRRRATRPS